MVEEKQLTVKQETVDLVAEKIKAFQSLGEIALPPNYSPDNALKCAWLKIQEVEDKDHKKAIEVCTKESIANAMLSMVIQGLNVDKNQGYFIVYGKKLTFQRSYFGTMAVAKMVDNSVGEILAGVVYEGDSFKFRTNGKGKKEIVEHESSLENINNKNIIAAYAVILDKSDNIKSTEIKTFEEIKQAWKQSKMYPVDAKGNLKIDSVHDKFTADMCKKTLINFICKPIINGSDDKGLLSKVTRQDDMDNVDADAEEEIEQNANKEIIEVIPVVIEAVGSSKDIEPF